MHLDHTTLHRNYLLKNSWEYASCSPDFFKGNLSSAFTGTPVSPFPFDFFYGSLVETAGLP